MPSGEMVRETNRLTDKAGPHSLSGKWGTFGVLIPWIMRKYEGLGLVRFSIVLLVLTFSCLDIYWSEGSDVIFSPVPHNGDEITFYVVASQMVINSDLNPRWFGHPGATLIYPTAAFILLTGSADLKALPAKTWDGIPPWLPKGIRIIPFVYFAGSVFLAFLLFRSHANGLIGVLGALLLAYSPRAQSLAFILRTDTASLFFACLALLAANHCAAKPTTVRHVLFGGSLGVAFATKYSLLFLWITYLGVLFQTWRLHAVSRSDLTRLVGWALGGFMGAAFLVSPFLFLEPSSALHFFAEEIAWQSPTVPPIGNWGNLASHAAALWDNHGIIWVPLALLGLASFILERNFVALASGLGGVAFLFVICFHKSYYSRWLLPLLPILWLYASRGAYTFLRAALKQLGREPQRVAPATEFSSISIRP